MSNVPTLTITAQGVQVPQAVDVFNGVLADENQAFGGNLDITTAGTPQYFLAQNLTQYITAENSAIAYMVSQVDPATSEGRMQDAIGRIYFLTRKPATSSVVQAQCTGQPGVTLPAGVLARDIAGNFWASSGAATFSGSGVVNVQFACVTQGPVQLGIGQLTTIAQLVPGWDAITNLGAATVGDNEETRAEFEQRRQESVAKGGKGSVQAVRGMIWQIPGVLDVFSIDNPTNAVVNYGPTNYPLAPHSIYVAVVGGADADIAQAIWETKDCGCDMNGNTTVVIQDQDNLSYPYPTYNIKFERPPALAVKFAVQIANNASLPADIINLTKQAIIATFNGTNGATRARIGSRIFASSYFGAVAAIAPTVSIVSLLVGTTTPTLNSVDVGIDQAPTVQASDISVTLV